MNSHEASGETHLVVRAMQPKDYGRVSEIMASCFHHLADKESWSEAQLETLLQDARAGKLAEMASNPSFHFRVALKDYSLVGVVLWIRNEIGKLYVDPPAHRNGVGIRLFHAAEKEITDEGYEEIRLTTPVTSVPFYVAMGMAVEERRPWETATFSGQNLFVMAKKASRLGDSRRQIKMGEK